jgi:RNA polymerase sigma-70 factor, ECF subfamily
MSHDSPEALTSDEELACRARQGCAASFEQLLRRFQTPVLHFLRRRGFSADAEDLAQETFLRAYQNLHRYNRRWAFSTWLFTIARRTSLNHRRRLRPTADARAVEGVLSAAPAPLENLVAEEARRRLWDRAAGVLSEEQVTALWLYYVEDMPAREIARVLERSWASVKVMLFRARKRLLPLLGEFAGDCLDFRVGENGTVPFRAAFAEERRRRANPQKETRQGLPVAVELEAPHV